MKLLELMLRRREQEDKEAEERRRAHRAWDLERQKREQRAALRHTSSLKKPREKVRLWSCLRGLGGEEYGSTVSMFVAP